MTTTEEIVPPPRIRYRIELLVGEAIRKSIRVRGYRPTARREAERICEWDPDVTAYQLRRIRDDAVLDHTEIPKQNPTSETEKELKP